MCYSFGKLLEQFGKTSEEIHSLTHTNNANQIKDEKQLIDFCAVVKFVSNRLDKLENNSLEK